MNSKKRNTKISIAITILSVLVLAFGGYIVYDKVVDKKESFTNTNTNNTNQPINKGKLQKYVGIYEALAVLDVEDSKDTLTGTYELEIKEDSSCIFRYLVTKGSGWIYEGNCSATEKEIILNSTKFSFDAEEENKVEEIKFTINGDGTLSYLTDDIQMILKKSLAKTAFHIFVEKYNLKIADSVYDEESIKDCSIVINAQSDDYTLEMYEFSGDGDKSAKEYFESQKRYQQDTKKEQRVLASTNTSKYDIYESTMTPNLENAPAAIGDEVSYILQIRVENYVIVLFQESNEADKTTYINLGKELKEMLNIK